MRHIKVYIYEILKNLQLKKYKYFLDLTLHWYVCEYIDIFYNKHFLFTDLVMGFENFSFLARKLPSFKVHGSQIRIIHEPSVFYQELVSRSAGSQDWFSSCQKSEMLWILRDKNYFYKVLELQ